jgi:hypothetical protein
MASYPVIAFTSSVFNRQLWTQAGIGALTDADLALYAKLSGPDFVNGIGVSGGISADTIAANSLQLTSGAASGYILVSDATGHGTWQNVGAANLLSSNNTWTGTQNFTQAVTATTVSATSSVNTNTQFTVSGVQLKTTNLGDVSSGTFSVTDVSQAIPFTITTSYGVYTIIGKTVFFDVQCAYPVNASPLQATIGNFPAAPAAGGVWCVSVFIAASTPTLVIGLLNNNVGVGAVPGLRLYGTGAPTGILNSALSGKAVTFSGWYTKV